MKLLLIDTSGLFHKAKHGMNTNLTYEDQRVEIIFTFLNSLKMIKSNFPNFQTVFALDSRINVRRTIYPSYKFHRSHKEKTPEEIEFDRLAWLQFSELKLNILPSLGFRNIFHQTGYESDDIIASIVKNHDGNCVICSRDKDFYQLLSDTCSIFDPHERKHFYQKNLQKIYRITPKQWLEAKIIGGCVSDEVPGIDGVSDVAKSESSKALAYVRGELKPGKISERINVEKARIEENRKLIALPFKGVNTFTIIPDVLHSKDFRDCFESLGFQSFLRNDEFRQWQEVFRLL